MDLTQITYQKRRMLINLLVASFSILSIVVGIGHVVIDRIEENITDQLHDELQTVVQTTNESIIHWAEHHQRNAYLWASAPKVVNLTIEQLEAVRNKQSIFANDTANKLNDVLSLMIEREGYIGYFIVSPELIRISDYRSIMIGEGVPKELHSSIHNAVDGGSHITRPIGYGPHSLHYPKDTPKGIHSSFALSPIVNGEGATIAVLALHIPSTVEWTHISSIGRFGLSGETYFVDEDGTLLYESHSIDDVIATGSPLSDVVSSTEAQLPSDRTSDSGKPAIDKQSFPIHSIAQVTKYRDGSMLQPYPDYRGIPVLGAWNWNHELGVGVISEIEEEEAYSVLRLARWSYWAAIAGTAFLLLWINIFSYRRSFGAVRLAEEEILLRQREQVLRAESDYLAMHDSLTGLPNHRFFVEMGEKMLSRAKREQSGAGIFFVDVDRFKEINDTYGHDAGDKYLVEIAKRLKQVIREGDLICRKGGDEFVMIFYNVLDNESMVVIASRVLELLKTPIKINDETELYKTISIGMTLFPRDSDKLELLVKRADEAMYQVKQSGRDGYKLYGD